MFSQLLAKPACARTAVLATRHAASARPQVMRVATRATENAASIEVDDDAIMNMFGTTVKRRLNKLKELRVEKELVDTEYMKEKLALDQKFVAKYNPIFDQRRDVISAKLEVPDYELQPTDDEDAKDDGIPDFWLVALTNNDTINNEISDEDARVLAYLTDIRYDIVVDEERNAGGWVLEFHFKENPFFKNAVLKKTYLLELVADMVPKSLEGTKIEWYPGKDTTVREVKKRVKSKGKVTVVARKEPVESFFNLFNPAVLPETFDDLDEEELGALTDEVDRDYELGVAIKELVVMDAVGWFTGESVQDYGGEEMEEDEYDEGDEFEEEEEVQPASKGRGIARR
jgi:nucleosome assembly protein 1-like 1